MVAGLRGVCLQVRQHNTLGAEREKRSLDTGLLLEGSGEAPVHRTETPSDRPLGKRADYEEVVFPISCVLVLLAERFHMYRRLTLLRLAKLIARNSNRQALQELHNNRSVFYYHDQQPLRLVEFVDQLRQSKPAWRWCNREVEVLDGAYDLTISKFSNLPDVEKMTLR